MFVLSSVTTLFCLLKKILKKSKHFQHHLSNLSNLIIKAQKI